MKKLTISILLSLSASAFATSSFSPDLSKVSDTDLEKTYWDCDYLGTQTMLSFDEAAVCSATFEELKKRKFSGDFQKFMSWWQANKAAEYVKRDRKL